MTDRQDSGDAIVITGIGAITPIGIGGEALWKSVLTSQCGIDTVTRFDATPFTTQIAAEVNGFDPLDFLDPKQARRMDRYSQLSVAAGTMALRDAGLAPETLTPHRTGVCLGTALGGVGMAEQEHKAFMERGPRAISPHLALSVFIGAGSCNIAIEFGFTGPATANGDSCASGLIALGNALHYLRRGEADIMLAGAAEAPLSPLTFNAFSVIRAMSTRNDDPKTASRPFDRLRDGFVMAEGAAMFVLETRRHAENRGAPIYAELASYSLTNDAQHMAAPRGDGESAARAMRQAIERADLTTDDIVALSAHASSTPLNDKTETTAIKRAFGEERARQVPIFGTKGLHGHALGATGAFEAAICCLAMRHGMIPGTANLTNPDPECDLDYGAGGARPFMPAPILSNSFGFGGINSCVVFKPVV